MPAIDTASNRAAPQPKKPKRRPEPRPRSKPQPTRRTVRVTPDQADRNKQVVETRRRSSMTPDTADRNRAPEQIKRDRQVRDTNVRESRVKALRNKRKREWNEGGGLAGALLAPVRAQQGSGGTKVVNAAEARRARAQGKTVRTRTAAERNDVGASQTSIGGGGTALSRVPIAVAAGIAKDPKTAIPATLKGLRDMVTGAPASIVKSITDPKGSVTEMGNEYARRYGGINKPGGVGKMADRISKEGAAAELVDIVTTGVPIGKGADALLGKAARAGKLGKKLEAATKKERAKVRVSGDDVREQKRGRGLTQVLRENRKDRRAREAVVRDVSVADDAAVMAAGKKAAGAPADPRANRGEVDAVVREAFGRGEIVPTRAGVRGRQVSQRQLRRAQERAYAGEKGIQLARQRTEQREEIFRGSHKVLSGLNPAEQRAFKYAMQSGARTPEAGVKALKRQRAIIEKTRRDGQDTGNTDVDELPIIDAILADPHRHFTPRLERAVDTEMMRGARVGEGDPSLGLTATERAETAEARRMAPQAELTATRRKGTLVDDAIKSGDARVRQAGKRTAKAKADLERAELRAAGERGYAQAGVDRAKRGADRALEGEARAVQIHRKAALNHERNAGRARSDASRAAHLAKAEAAWERATSAAVRMADKQAEKATIRPEHRPAVQKSRSRVDNARRRHEDAVQVQRAAQDAAASVRRQKKDGTQLVGAESMRDFHGRVVAARPEGMRDPGFFPSVRREQTRFSPFTIGGARRAKQDGQYRGKLMKAGREDGSVTSYEQSLAKNIKRKYNWSLIGSTIQRHAFEWSRKMDKESGEFKGMKYGEIMDELAKRGIDPQSVRIVDMDAFSAGAKSAADGGDGVAAGSGKYGTPKAVSEADLTLHETLTRSYKDAADVDEAAKLQPGAGRLLVLPKHVGDEILSDTKPSGAFGRSLDVLKGKQARVMLGLSPAWLQFQVAANVLQTGMATKSLPSEWVYANLKWWRNLTDEQRRALEPHVGVGAFHDALEQPKLGASAQGGIVNSYRAFKAHEFWHKARRRAGGRSISQMNPLDVLFRLDNAQNNFFRRAVLYNSLKRQAFDRMGESMVSMQRAQGKVLGKVGSDPKAMIDSLVHDRKSIEAAAESLRDFLGDYQTYTAKERRVLQRNIMFYGYLRFSLRFTFYTMPVKHPVMTGILAQMGGLNAREVRELLGGDQLPWALGKLYWTKDGKLKELDLSRANPFMNAITQAKIPERGVFRGLLQSAAGFLPPMVGSAANIMFSKSLFKDRAYKVNGEAGARPNKEGEAITDADAVQIFTKEMLGLVALYRMEEKARADGRPISDDSVIGIGENYTEYKDPKLRRDTRRAEGETSPGKIRLQQLLPLIPKDSRDVETAAKIRRAKGEKAESGSAPSTANAPDDEASRMFDAYSQDGATQDVDVDELEKLMKAYSGG